MITQETCFYSNGYRLAASLYLPDDYESGVKLPCIIPNSGYIGFNCIYPALFSKALTEKGFACFGFDYRGFKQSEGPAGVCRLDDQVEDIRNAVTFVRTLTEVDPRRIGVIGWGMAAGLVAKVTQMDNRVRAAAGLNGFYNGNRWLRQVLSFVDFVRMCGETEAEKNRFVQTGQRVFGDPFHFYPMDPDTTDVVKNNLYPVKDYGQEISLEIGQSLLEFDAEKCVTDIKVPFFVGHGIDNLLHPISESEQFFEKLPGEKVFYVINGKHNDFMFDDHPVFLDLIKQLATFFLTPLR